MKMQREDMHTKRGSSKTNDGATDLVSDPELDQEAIAFSLLLLGGARLPA